MTHLLTALLLLLLGYLVKYRQWSWLIAGYNTSSQKSKDAYDKKALCNGVGNFLFLLAGILSLAVIGEYFGESWLVSLSWGLFVIAMAIFLVYANTGGRYKKKGD